MNQVAFLVDENVPAAVGNALLALVPSCHVRTVGVDPDVPAKQTPDPDLLRFAEDNGLALVTFDKDTMPGHAADHLATGRHTWGLFVFPNGYSLSAGRVAAELVMIWSASAADEWVDLTVFLPM